MKKENYITNGSTYYLLGAKIISAYGKMPQYIGKVGIRDGGTALYTVNCAITRLSRGDALNDAHTLATDLIIQNQSI